MRAQIMKENEKDARGHNLKVSYNSAYGKLAQSVGRKGHPPKFASPWLAGAITAPTRRLALEAALKDPYAVIRFATDAVQSKRSLDLECAAEKVLGAWMKKTFPLGGSYVQAGLWLNRENEGKFKIATRRLLAQTRSAASTHNASSSSGNCWKQSPSHGRPTKMNTSSIISNI